MANVSGSRWKLICFRCHFTSPLPNWKNIEKAIKESEGNKSDAANRLQINRRLLYNKIEEHKLEE